MRPKFALHQRQRTKTVWRFRTFIFISLLTAISFSIAFLYFNLGIPGIAIAAASGDYRSLASGNWNSTSSWETYNGTAWVAAVATPTSADGVITIQSGHTVTVTASVTADQVVVDAGGQITVSSGTLTIADGSGTDINVSGTIIFNSTLSLNASATFNLSGTGTLNSSGTVTISSNALITILSGGTYNDNGGTETRNAGWAVNNGGTYILNANAVNVPNGTWGSSSTLKITGVTNIDPDVQGQVFGNLIYDCPSQTGNLDFADKLTTINGDFTVVSTGTGSIKFDRSSSNVTLYVAGNYSQTGGTLKITTMGNWNISVAGNFSLSGGTFIMAGTDGVPALTVTGNMTISGGTLDMSQYTGNTSGKGIGTINLYGNFTQTAGTLTETATQIGKGDIFFAKSGTQTFSITGGAITNTINFTVNSTTILDAGNNIFTGSGTFTLVSGGGIILGNSDGISSSGATGNIQVTGTRTFSTGANYTYSGTSAQNTGSGLPSTVNKFILNNSSGLTLTNSVIVSSILTFTNGNLTTPSDTITLGTAQSNTGTLTRTSGHVIGYIKRWFSSSTVSNILFPVGTSSYYEGANVTITSVPSGGTVTANFVMAVNSYAGLELSDGGYMIGTLGDGYWQFTPADGMSGGAFTLDLYANSLAPVVTDYTKMHVVRKAVLSDPWSLTGTHTAGTGSNANPVAHRLSATSWNIFAIGSSVQYPLPVGLLYFDISPAAHAVNCMWETSSEINNDFFTVERSPDGKNFMPLETIIGAGNSSAALNYSFTDRKPLSGINYYRLMQTDYDGKFTYSPIKSVNIKTVAGTIAINSVSPNPFKNNFSISYSVQDDATVNISIINAAGQNVYEQKLNAVKGFNRFDYDDALLLPNGIYFAKLIAGNQVQIQKIVKN